MSIKVENLNYIYSQGTAFEHYALKNINFTVNSGEFVGIIGHTGSGKSTMIQHLNGLLKATSGKIFYKGEDIYAEGFDFKKLRQKVGLVFQYPEHQLFEVDVLSDVCFGPMNQGLTREEAEIRAVEALTMTGIAENYYNRSPFELSGGQKRRVAIAGVLAMRPEVLILDEPTAGLDPFGKEEILNKISELRELTGMTVMLVSHSMEDVAKYVSRLMVMSRGELVFDDVPKEVFKHYKDLEKIGLSAPSITYIIQELIANGIALDDGIMTTNEACRAIMDLIGEGGK